MDNIQSYIEEVKNLFLTQRAREHAYRPALHKLLETLRTDDSTKILNDPKRSEHGAPDFIILKKELPIGYIETKDIGVNLDKAETSEQLTRYYGYSNLILTDYLEFRFFINGEKSETISIGSIEDNKIVIKDNKLEDLESALKDFVASRPENIRSGLQLAKIMGGKARRIRDNVRRFLEIESEHNEELERIYEVIKKLLIHDLSKERFSDMYAQTLVYGLFIARYYDESEDTFTRQEARDLVPDTNPFLKNFFEHIAGANFDKRLAYIVNELCEIFSHSDVRALMQQYSKQLGLFGEDKELPDPVIHFYEDFLKEYDSKQRLELGVFYTPLPVVRFIVRSIDEILKKDFGLDKGLADSSKIERQIIVQGQKHKEKTHRVQVLDPATGTGTFLNEVINQIHKSFEGQEGRWKSYVNEDLLPRLYGFELMIASYTIAHLKLGLNLQSKGYKEFEKRIGVYLTNSLEDSLDPEYDLFSSIGLARAISEEAQKASDIKNKKPIMVVLGNPPYSVSSQNKGEWIQNLIKDYKENLNERKINLDDDYIKFIRFGQHFIEKNGEGILAYISNNSFIDGITHRRMRESLLKTFDKIYILDLHGNAKKRETAPDGSKDENVFDIQQGVSINIFVKTGKKHSDKLGKIYHTDLFGLRKSKYAYLNQNDINTGKWQELQSKSPNYFFIPSTNSPKSDYNQWIRVDELFPHYNSGIQTKNDKLSIKFTRDELEKVIQDFETLTESELKIKYNLKDTSGWQVKKAIDDLKTNPYNFSRILYRPFDIRTTVFTKTSGGFIGRPRERTMRNFIEKDNLGLITVRQQSTFDFQHALATNLIIESGAISLQTKEWGYVFPLYLYNTEDSQGELEFVDKREPNINFEIAENIAKTIGLKFVKESSSDTNTFSPIDIFDYVYSILYSPGYRKNYKQYLKIDFPRIPYPKNAEQFKNLANKGKELRELHIMESPALSELTTTYPIEGTDKVEKVTFSAGSVFINDKQYFGNVPEIAWNFYIGGYQPAQKWLKDRIGRTLSSEEIEHYQKIIKALTETDRIMKEIDSIYVI